MKLRQVKTLRHNYEKSWNYDKFKIMTCWNDDILSRNREKVEIMKLSVRISTCQFQFVNFYYQFRRQNLDYNFFLTNDFKLKIK